MPVASASADTDHAPAGSLRELLGVALPLIISSGSLSLMHVVDRVMLTWYSEAALAASTPGGMLQWTMMSLPYGVVTYVNTFVAQYDGAGRKERVAASIWQALWLALGCGVLLAFATPATRHLTSLFGHEAVVQQLESEYFSVLSLGTPAAMATAALSAFYSGRGRTHVLMVINAVTAVTNGLINWLLIFGPGPFPELGVAGAAWGTVLAQLLGCVLYVVCMATDAESRVYPFWKQCRLDRPLLGRIFRYGIPNGVQFLIDIGAYLLLMVFIGRIGSRELAATNLAFNLNSLAFIPMLGIGTSVSTLVGRRVGEGRPQLAIRTTWLAFGLAAAYNGVWALIYLFGQDAILAPFASYGDPQAFAELRPMVETLLIYVVLYLYFDAMAVIFGAAIRGAGDTRFSLVYTAIVLWTTMVAPIWWIQRNDGSLYACWGVLICQLMILGIGFLVRFLQGRWLTMRVIEHGPAEVPPDLPAESAAVGMLTQSPAQDVLAESIVFEAHEQDEEQFPVRSRD